MKHIEIFGDWYHVDSIIFVSKLMQKTNFTINGPKKPFYFFYLTRKTSGDSLEVKIDYNFGLSNEQVKDLHLRIINFIKSQK